jgi:hypothetical protein
MFNSVGWSPRTSAFRFQRRGCGEQQSVPPHRSREDGLTHPADTSRSNLVAALGLLSRWRLFKPQQPTRLEISIHENPDSTHPGTPDPCTLFSAIYTCVRTAAHNLWSGGSPGLMVWRLRACSMLMAPGSWATAPTRCIMSYARQCPCCNRVGGAVGVLTSARNRFSQPSFTPRCSGEIDKSASHVTVELCACARAMG